MSLLRQFAGQTLIYGVGHILSRVLLFLVLNSYMTYRLEDLEEFGNFNIMYGWSTLLIVLLSYRIDTAFFRFGSKEGSLRKAFSSAFFPLLITTTIAVLLIITFSSEISDLLRMGDYPHYFRWFAIILGFDVISLLPFGKLRLENKAKTFMLLRVANVILMIVLVLYFLEVYFPANPDGGMLKKVFHGLNNEVDYVFIANLISSVLVFVGLLFTVGKISWKIDWNLWKKMALYSSPLIIVGIANSINQYFSPQLQQFFLGGDNSENITQAGIYSASLKIASLLVMFNTAFNYAAEPFFFRNAANKNDKQIYSKVLSLYTITAIVMLVGLIYYIDIFKYLIGTNYREGIHLIPIMLFAFLLLGVYYNVSIWYKLADKNIYGGLISCIGVVITLSISIILLPKIGYAASAWASLFCYGGMVLCAFYFGKKHYPIKYDLKQLFLLVCSSIIMILLAMVIDKLNLSILISILVKTILFLIFVFFLFKQNKSLISELIRPKEQVDVLTSGDSRR